MQHPPFICYLLSHNTKPFRHLSYLCPAGIFNGNGGNLVLMGFMHHWPDLCAAMNRPELVDDPFFATDADRLERRDEVVQLIEEWLATFADVHSAVATLENHGIPCAPILSVEETLSYPHLVERGTVRTVDDRLAGEFQIPGMPIKSSAYPEEPGYSAPTLGEHNREILRGFLKRSDVEIEALVEAGVLVSGEY